MANAISYALWGKDAPRQHECFDYESYLRGMAMCIRMNRLLYPDWVTVIHTNDVCFESLVELYENIKNVHVIRMPDGPLCYNMLWRLFPIYCGYDRVLCRDSDSPATWRERAMVQEWITDGTAAHTITDSTGHGLAMLGGMIGFCSREFREMTKLPLWDVLLTSEQGIDFNVKGSDQTYINKVLYPCFARKGQESITAHYIKGMPDNFLRNYHRDVPTGNLPFLDETLQDSNDITGHTGAAGFYETAMMKFIRRFEGQFNDIENNERKYNKSIGKNVFYWV